MQSAKNLSMMIDHLGVIKSIGTYLSRSCQSIKFRNGASHRSDEPSCRPSGSQQGRQGPSVNVGGCGDRRAATLEDICNFAISCKLHRSVYPRRCAMWQLSDGQALIFMTLIVVAVALA